MIDLEQGNIILNFSSLSRIIYLILTSNTYMDNNYRFSITPMWINYRVNLIMELNVSEFCSKLVL